MMIIIIIVIVIVIIPYFHTAPFNSIYAQVRTSKQQQRKASHSNWEGKLKLLETKRLEDDTFGNLNFHGVFCTVLLKNMKVFSMETISYLPFIHKLALLIIMGHLSTMLWHHLLSESENWFTSIDPIDWFWWQLQLFSYRHTVISWKAVSITCKTGKREMSAKKPQQTNQNRPKCKVKLQCVCTATHKLTVSRV